MRKLKDIILPENSGDFSGAGTFQGGPYGFGNRYQLADSEVWAGLVDPAEDLPNNPSMWPAVHAQEESDKDDYESLESPEVYDDRPHILPGEDTVRDELLSKEPDLGDSYFDSTLTERNASDILYRDMPGFPANNTLSAPRQFVPDDEDEDRDPEEDPEEERYNVPSLLPGGREGDRGKPFGHGRYDAADSLNLPYPQGPEDSDMYDPGRDEITDNGLKLLQKKNKSLNRWKETEPENKGLNNGHLWDKLVKPVDFIKKSWGQQDFKDELDEPDDVHTRAGSMGSLANPVKHVPGPVDIYKKGNTGYALGEAKEKNIMAKKTTALKRELEDYTPEELDKKAPSETYGNGMGQVEKESDFDFTREGRKIKKIEPLEPETNYTPYEYDRTRINTIMMSKLFEKLAKLSEKK